MARHRDGVRVRKLERDLRERLYRVGVEAGARRMRGPRQLAYGVDAAGLVVGRHDAHEGDRVVEHACQRVRRDRAVAHRRDDRDLEPALAQGAGKAQDRVVLDGGDDHPGAPGVLCAHALGDARHAEVVGFGAAGGEDDLARPEAAAQGGGEVATCPLEG